jgi:hypothetical protein
VRAPRTAGPPRWPAIRLAVHQLGDAFAAVDGDQVSLGAPSAHGEPETHGASPAEVSWTGALSSSLSGVDIFAV